MRVLIAIEDGQLYATPKHQLTPPTRAYLTEHAAQIIRSIGPINQANLDLQHYEAIGERVLNLSTPPNISPMRPGFLGGTDDANEESSADGTAPAQTTEAGAHTTPEQNAAPRPVIRDMQPYEIHVTISAPVRRLIEQAKFERLPKGTLSRKGHMIADFPGYVHAYIIALLVGDRNDALRRLELAADMMDL